MSTQHPEPVAQPEKKTESDDFRKSVGFEKTDGTEQIAYGAVLVPNRVDHQGDFFSREAIEDFAEDFENRVENKDAVPGVLHAVFPDHISLAENRITDEAIELGDRDLPAGSWVQGWQFDDDELWSLVADGILAGYSIGGTVDGRIMYEEGAHPDAVEFPDEVVAELAEADLEPADVPIWEIAGGRTLEVSTVDMPAVPDATHEQYKAVGAGTALAKGAPQLTSSVVDARLYLESRGHSEEDAKRLAEYLVAQKSREPEGWIARAKRFFTPSAGGDDSHSQQSPAGRQAASSQAEAGDGTEKDGRTLSAANLESTMAIHDAALDLMDRSDVDHGRTRFSDDVSYDFDVADYGTDSDERAESRVGPQTQSLLENMNHEELEQKFETFSDRFDAIEAKLDNQTQADGGADGDDGTEKDGDGTSGDDVDQLEQAVDTLAANQQKMLETIEQMANAQGVSQQADQGNGTNGTEKTWDNSPFAVGGDR